MPAEVILAVDQGSSSTRCVAYDRLLRRRGDLEARAAIGERVYPGLVWMALHFAQAKVNWLTHDVGDPLIGTPEYKTSAIRIEPVGSALKPAAR